MKNLSQIKISISTLLIFLFIVPGFYKCSDSKKAEQEKIQKIIAAMTLEQKAKVVIGTGSHFELPDSIAKLFKRKEQVDNDTLYTQMTKKISKYLPGAAGFSAEFPELGITSQVLSDGPAGLRISPKRKGSDDSFYCTAFPIATVLASTWDPELVEKVGEAMGNEVLEYGADVLLGPAMNIQRDPLCGRNFEYYSEDPLITGKTAASMVNGIQSNGVGTSIKHFAANNQETNRMTVNAMISERALREIYLRGFEIAVTEAQPWTVMSSYNKINGTYTSESSDLLTKILRDDWGFKGYVMTDWGGGSDVVAQMKAGNDMIMPGSVKQIQEIIAAVKDGRLEESVLDRNLARIFSVMFKTPKYRAYVNSNKPDLKAHAEVTRQAASDGMVLLENKGNALPIEAGVGQLAVFGNTSYEFISGGTGSGDVNEAYTVSLIEGLKSANLQPDEKLAGIYDTYIKDTRANAPKPRNWWEAMMGGKSPVPEMNVTPELATEMAAKAQLALVTIGRNAGEGADRKAVDGDFYLSETEKSMVKVISDAFHSQGKKVIVILNVGGVIETASWRGEPDAVLCVWQPGQEAGNSVVDVLTGKVNPSGKLAVTFPMSYNDEPSAKTFPGHAVIIDTTDKTADVSGFSWDKRVPWEAEYQEDVFVGYRYFNTFNVPVAYEFGYGLSYTDFEFSKLKLSSSEFKNKITVSVEVKNSGKVPGREVAEVYLSAPAVKMKKPSAVLINFGKTKILAPGEAETITFVINPMDLCSFDESTSSWTAEAGQYKLEIGTSSRNFKTSADFSLPGELVVKTVSKALKPEKEITRAF